MAVAPAADRILRDKHLAGAMALLACAQVLHLIADSMRLTLLLDSTVSDVHQIAGWLNLLSDLPVLAGASLAVVAFRAGGVERLRWLRWGLLLAGLGFALAFISYVFEYGALESPAPEGMRLGLLASCVGTFAWTAGFLLAAAVIWERASEGGGSAQDRRLRRPSRIWGIALLSTGLSSWAYTLAYSTYPHNAEFTRGLVVGGIGSFAAGITLLYAASAFGGDGEARIARREKRLAVAAIALGLSLLLVGLGEAGRASGTTAIGYAESSAVADWVFAASRVFEAAAFLWAARGFEAVSRYAQHG